MDKKQIADALTDTGIRLLLEPFIPENSIRICSKKETEPDFVAVASRMDRVVVVVRGRTFDMTPEIFFDLIEEANDDLYCCDEPPADTGGPDCSDEVPQS